MSLVALTSSKYFLKLASLSVPDASSLASAESTATTKNVAPYKVSGLVV